MKDMNGSDEKNDLSEAAAHRLALVSGLVIAAAAAGAAVVFLFDPAESSFYPPCLFHAATGLHCAGCGSLRAAHQLLHGNLLAALGKNPLTVLALPFLGYAFLSYGVSAVRKRAPPGASAPAPAPAFWIWLLLGVVVAFWVLRNIPFYPLTLLAP